MEASISDSVKNLIIFGLGQIAEIAYFYFRQCEDYNVIGFTADSSDENPELFMDLPVIDYDTIVEKHPPADCDIFVALCYRNLNENRVIKFNEIKEKGYFLASYVHGSPDKTTLCKHGENCMILDPSMIQPYAELGDNVFVWQGALVGHHCKVMDHVWITSCANIGGNVNIGERCFIGINASICHMISIGEKSFIGANTYIVRDAPDKSVYVAPETERYRLDSERFLKLTSMI